MFLEDDVQNVEKFVFVLEEEEFFKKKIFSAVLRNSRDLVGWVGGR